MYAAASPTTVCISGAECKHFERFVSAHQLIQYPSTDGASISIRFDSQLVVEQLNRRWNVRDPELKAIWAKCQDQLQRLAKRACVVTVEWIPREENSEADRLCNQALDAVLR